MWHCPLRNPATCLTSLPRCPLGIWNFARSKQTTDSPLPKSSSSVRCYHFLASTSSRFPHTQTTTGWPPTGQTCQPVSLLLMTLSTTGLFLTSRRLHICPCFKPLNSCSFCLPQPLTSCLSSLSLNSISERLFLTTQQKEPPSHSGTSYVIFKAFVTTWYLNTYLQFISP